MRISILTPTRNAARYLPDCLESVRSQRDDVDAVEHLVIDGASTDGTVEIARGFGAAVVEVESSGIYYKLNTGLQHASGDVIGYLAGDDLLLPGALGTVEEWFSNGRNPILVGGILWTDAEGRSRGRLAAPPGWMTSEMLAALGWSCMQTTSVFLRRDFVGEIGGYDESFEYCGDYEFMVRALARSRFDRSSRCLSTWRMHGECLTFSNAEGEIAGELARIRAAYAPASDSRRNAYRLLLKVWLNANSPRWFLLKKFPSLGPFIRGGRSPAGRAEGVRRGNP